MDQANAIWGSILTSEQMKELLVDTNGQQTKRPKTSSTSISTRSSSRSQDELLMMVARLALRNESSLNAMLQEHQFLIHVNPGPGSLLPLMLAGTKQWHASTKSTPLRHHLVVLMLETLQKRAEILAKANPQDPVWKEAEQMMLITSDGQMPYLRWDAATRTLKPTKDAKLSIQEALRAVENLARLAADPSTTLRFHALTKPKETYDRAVPWLWLVSNRNQPEAWSEAHRLC